jgi:hypothetical protein
MDFARLLRVRRERPRGCCAKQADELPSPHAGHGLPPRCRLDHRSKRAAKAAFFCRVIGLPTNVSRILGADLNRSRPSPALARIISIAVRR